MGLFLSGLHLRLPSRHSSKILLYQTAGRRPMPLRSQGVKRTNRTKNFPQRRLHIGQRHRMLWIEHLESRAMLDAGLGILLLDHSSAGALTSTGSGGVRLAGNSALIIDSNSARAGIDTGTGNISASPIGVVGGVKTYGSGKFQGSVVHSTVDPDPLAGLPVPPITT